MSKTFRCHYCVGERETDGEHCLGCGMPLNDAAFTNVASKQRLSFDYEQVPSAFQQELRVHAVAIKGRLKSSGADAVEIGRHLDVVRERLRGTQLFSAWIEAEFPWGLCTANYYIAVSRRFGEHVDILDAFDITALRILAARSVPDTVVARAVGMAEEGDLVTYSRARDLVAEHSPCGDVDGIGDAVASENAISESEIPDALRASQQTASLALTAPPRSTRVRSAKRRGSTTSQATVVDRLVELWKQADEAQRFEFSERVGLWSGLPGRRCGEDLCFTPASSETSSGGRFHIASNEENS